MLRRCTAGLDVGSLGLLGLDSIVNLFPVGELNAETGIGQGVLAAQAREQVRLLGVGHEPAQPGVLVVGALLSPDGILGREHREHRSNRALIVA
ncbi:MAG: hypothetical protein M3Q29_16080 [Chloroflexota bacterium]|nr:hypothetical protein [Chloroflexota bacterium]